MPSAGSAPLRADPASVLTLNITARRRRAVMEEVVGPWELGGQQTDRIELCLERRREFQNLLLGDG